MRVKINLISMGSYLTDAWGNPKMAYILWDEGKSSSALFYIYIVLKFKTR